MDQGDYTEVLKCDSVVVVAQLYTVVQLLTRKAVQLLMW